VPSWYSHRLQWVRCPITAVWRSNSLASPRLFRRAFRLEFHKQRRRLGPSRRRRFPALPSPIEEFLDLICRGHIVELHTATRNHVARPVDQNVRGIDPDAVTLESLAGVARLCVVFLLILIFLLLLLGRQSTLVVFANGFPPLRFDPKPLQKNAGLSGSRRPNSGACASNYPWLALGSDADGRDFH